MDRQPWRANALCKDLSPEEADKLFFFGPGNSSHKAKAFCMACPVRVECNNYAILYEEVGAWAGLADAERRSLIPIVQPALRKEAIVNGNLEDHDVSNFIKFVQPLDLLEFPA